MSFFSPFSSLSFSFSHHTSHQPTLLNYPPPTPPHIILLYFRAYFFVFSFSSGLCFPFSGGGGVLVSGIEMIYHSFSIGQHLFIMGHPFFWICLFIDYILTLLLYLFRFDSLQFLLYLICSFFLVDLSFFTEMTGI